MWLGEARLLLAAPMLVHSIPYPTTGPVPHMEQTAAVPRMSPPRFPHQYTQAPRTSPSSDTCAAPGAGIIQAITSALPTPVETIHAIVRTVIPKLAHLAPEDQLEAELQAAFVTQGAEIQAAIETLLGGQIKKLESELIEFVTTCICAAPGPISSPGDLTTGSSPSTTPGTQGSPIQASGDSSRGPPQDGPASPAQPHEPATPTPPIQASGDSSRGPPQDGPASPAQPHEPATPTPPIQASVDSSRGPPQDGPASPAQPQPSPGQSTSNTRYGVEENGTDVGGPADGQARQTTDAREPLAGTADFGKLSETDTVDARGSDCYDNVAPIAHPGPVQGAEATANGHRSLHAVKGTGSGY